MALQVSLFGSFQVSVDERPLIRFRSDKVRALLAYLIIEGNRPHRRDALATLLWPYVSDKGARQNLRLSFFRLRRVIDMVAGYPLSQHLFTSDYQSIQTNIIGEANLAWSDVAEFQAQISMCESCRAADFFACVPCQERLVRGIDLYQGELLPGFYIENAEPFEEWLLLTRERYHNQAITMLESLIAIYQKREQYERVCDYTQRLLALEPWRENAHRQLMLALAGSGKRGVALAQFEKCRQILHKELRVEPGAETVAVYERIKADRDWSLASRTKQVSSVIGNACDASSRSNLPAFVTSFWGRESEREELAQMVVDPAFRLVTLVGEGGVGKSRLALETAVQVCNHFRDGVWFVPLIDVERQETMYKLQDGIISAVATVLDFKLYGQQPPKEQLITHLRDRHLLLMLDNFEHLLDGAYLVVELLHHAPQVSVLCTSRESLHLLAEYVYPVSGLSLPTGEGMFASQEMSPSQTSASINLFADRARYDGTGFEVTVDNVAQITQVCHLAAGNPLGIELAATLLRYHSLEQILESLPSSLDFLSTRQRDVPLRHQSMRAVFTNSWELLQMHEQHILAQLSVFRGHFTPEDAQIMTGTSLMDLENLREKSLVHKTVEKQYVIHELLRQFAHEQLETAVTTYSDHNLVTVQEYPVI